jgi:hypothetical protein
MLIADGAGPWQRAADRRFLVAAGEGEGPRYRLVREGRDDDGDGLFNEDGPGGVRLDRNFPHEWVGPRSPLAPGPLPLSEPGSHAIAQLLMAPGVFGALFFEGSSGSVQGASEWVTRANDGEGGAVDIPDVTGPRRIESPNLLVDLVHEIFASTIGPDAAADSREPIQTPGSPATWAWRALGIPSMRIAAWGPELGTERGSASQTAAFTMRDPELDAGRMPRERGDEFDYLVCPPGSGAMPWRAWLDERRGGIGFVDWHPVELEGAGSVLVGGWEALTVENPPEDQLASGVVGSVALVRGILDALPAPRVEIVASSREGELCNLSARAQAQNAGRLPGDFFAPDGLRIRLSLPEGARLIAGAEETAWSLSGVGEGEPVEWLVFAPVDALFKVQLLSIADGRVVAEREVRP